MSAKHERVIIGESAQAGLPISAPVVDSVDKRITLRWRCVDGAFVLEQWVDRQHGHLGCWIEVPLLRETDL